MNFWEALFHNTNLYELYACKKPSFIIDAVFHYVQYIQSAMMWNTSDHRSAVRADRRRLQISTSAVQRRRWRLRDSRDSFLYPRCGNLKPRKRASLSTNAAAVAAAVAWRKWNTDERRRHELNLGCYDGIHLCAVLTLAKRTLSLAISHSGDKPSKTPAAKWRWCMSIWTQIRINAKKNARTTEYVTHEQLLPM